MSLLSLRGYIEVFTSVNVYIYILNKESKLSIFLKFIPFWRQPGCTVYKLIRVFIDTIKIIYQLKLWPFLKPSSVKNLATILLQQLQVTCPAHAGSNIAEKYRKITSDLTFIKQGDFSMYSNSRKSYHFTMKCKLPFSL